MSQFNITGSTLELPRTLNGVELAPEPGNIKFPLATVQVKWVPQEIDGQTVPEVSLACASRERVPLSPVFSLMFRLRKQSPKSCSKLLERHQRPLEHNQSVAKAGGTDIVVHVCVTSMASRRFWPA